MKYKVGDKVILNDGSIVIIKEALDNWTIRTWHEGDVIGVNKGTRRFWEDDIYGKYDDIVSFTQGTYVGAMDIPVMKTSDLKNDKIEVRSNIVKKPPTKMKVFFNDKKRATTLQMGDKFTVVKAMKGDKYNREFGFLMAYFQAVSGMSKTQAKKYIKEVVKQNEKV